MPSDFPTFHALAGVASVFALIFLLWICICVRSARLEQERQDRALAMRNQRKREEKARAAHLRHGERAWYDQY